MTEKKRRERIEKTSRRKGNGENSMVEIAVDGDALDYCSVRRWRCFNSSGGALFFRVVLVESIFSFFSRPTLVGNLLGFRRLFLSSTSPFLTTLNYIGHRVARCRRYCFVLFSLPWSSCRLFQRWKSLQPHGRHFARLVDFLHYCSSTQTETEPCLPHRLSSSFLSGGVEEETQQIFFFLFWIFPLSEMDF